MKDQKAQKSKEKTKGKTNPFRIVNKSQENKPKTKLETMMSIPLIATISVISLGLLTYLTGRLYKETVKQPILIEKRQIVYKRKH